MQGETSALTELLRNTFPGLLERLAEDMKEIKTELKDTNRRLETLRNDEMERLRSRLAEEREARAAAMGGADLRAATLKAEVDTNSATLRDLAERLRWLSRLVVGALVSGVIGGALAFIFKGL